MRKTARELKEWLKKIDDDALITVDIYTNKKTKELIIATEWGDSSENNEKEFIVAETIDYEDIDIE